MKIQKWVCDRCSAEILEERRHFGLDTERPWNTSIKSPPDPRLNSIQYKRLDLCGACFDELQEFLKKKKKLRFCGGDRCTGLWNIPCDALEHLNRQRGLVSKDEWEENYDKGA